MKTQKKKKKKFGQNWHRNDLFYSNLDESPLKLAHEMIIECKLALEAFSCHILSACIVHQYFCQYFYSGSFLNSAVCTEFLICSKSILPNG